MKNASIYLLLACALLLIACAQPQPVTLSGPTMGTTWSVKLAPEYTLSDNKIKALTQGVQSVLDGVNQAMSTYQKDSELSLFNALPTPQCVPASKPLLHVVSAGLELYKKSDGAFDATIGPLVNAWGFGPSPKVNKVPSDAVLQTLKEHMGSQHIRIKGNTLCKDRANIKLDLSAIAKGYGVDVVRNYLNTQGFNNALIEVGGELYASGTKTENTPWKIAIETPASGQRSAFKQSALPVTNIGIATSGDYRNYFEENGVRYSHTIDPSTAHPITHKLASVTVLANSAMMADGWATAMMVLGEDKGIKKANSLGLKVFMILRKNGNFISKHSQTFPVSDLNRKK